MSELISRWSKKHLSQTINLVSGMLLCILLINEFININIQCEWLKFVSVGSNIIQTNFWTWLLSVLLLNRILFDVVKYFMRITFNPYDEDKYYNRLVIIYTIENIVEMASAIYGMLFVLTLFNADKLNNSCLYIFTCLVIGIRFLDSIWHHFYYGNLKIVNKAKTGDSQEKD